MSLQTAFTGLQSKHEIQQLVKENELLAREINHISHAAPKQRTISGTDQADLSCLEKTKLKTLEATPSIDNIVRDAVFVPISLPVNEADGLELPSRDCCSAIGDLCTPDQASRTLEFTKGLADIPSKLTLPLIDSGCEEEHDSKHNKPDRKVIDEVAKRLIGEIAFQLDRRILQFIFAHRKRLYGFTVRNISQKIGEYCADFRTGAIDEMKKELLVKKRDEIFRFLQTTSGYNSNYHPIFSEMLINKFGVLKINNNKNKSAYEPLRELDYLKSVILTMLDQEYTYDALIILYSLKAFSDFDGKPLFVW